MNHYSIMDFYKSYIITHAYYQMIISMQYIGYNYWKKTEVRIFWFLILKEGAKTIAQAGRR